MPLHVHHVPTIASEAVLRLTSYMSSQGDFTQKKPQPVLRLNGIAPDLVSVSLSISSQSTLLHFSAAYDQKNAHAKEIRRPQHAASHLRLLRLCGQQHDVAVFACFFELFFRIFQAL